MENEAICRAVKNVLHRYAVTDPETEKIIAFEITDVVLRVVGDQVAKPNATEVNG